MGCLFELLTATTVNIGAQNHPKQQWWILCDSLRQILGFCGRKAQQELLTEAIEC